MPVADPAIEAQQLAKALADAFRDRQYPGDDQLAAASADNASDAAQVTEFFRGKNWQQINAESIATSVALDPNAFMYFMTPKAFVYYLPAMLTIALNVMDAPEMADAIHFSLKPSDNEEQPTPVQSWQAERLALLNTTERDVVTSAWRFIDKQLQAL